MINIVQFLEKNPSILELLKEKKVSLLGVTELETRSILESYEKDLSTKSMLWA
ncbi:competence pheromone ComX [Terribacillus saccharophilus]|uniref:ComX pheromone n=1 Tax=Terribacillus saccharophilus TaxID=361277 RepID=A0A268AG98_9BACI|nr:competence pheromone ComX [Terribacillus saccharophilus]PAD23146.1 competence protein ComX [Terribacillus saccharophilus]